MDLGSPADGNLLTHGRPVSHLSEDAQSIRGTLRWRISPVDPTARCPGTPGFRHRFGRSVAGISRQPRCRTDPDRSEFMAEKVLIVGASGIAGSAIVEPARAASRGSIGYEAADRRAYAVSTSDETHAPPMNRAERRALAAKTRQRTPRRCACCAPDPDKHDHSQSDAGQPSLANQSA